MSAVDKLHRYLNENSDELYAGEMHLHTIDLAHFLVNNWSKVKRLIEDDVRLERKPCTTFKHSPKSILR